MIKVHPVSTYTHTYRYREERDSSYFHYSFNSSATLEAICLNSIVFPEILLKRTPLTERRGSLQTSISHWTRLPPSPSPCEQNTKKRSFFSNEMDFLASRTRQISSMMAGPSLVVVVFMLHVKRRERGFSSVPL